jgi:hypothetical protein
MAQKVITVSGWHHTDDASIEFDFPSVTTALNDGYEVKQVHQMAMPNNKTFTITFVLEKDESYTGFSPMSGGQ